MFGRNWQRMANRALLSCLIAVIAVLGTTSCGDRPSPPPVSGIRSAPLIQPAAKIEEVSPPEVIQQLGQVLDRYRPQISIFSPRPDEILPDNTVTVELQVRDLPLFLDPQLEMGPHLEIILDNQPYTTVYDLNQPLVFEDLSPGTHTLRVFASRPWHESFKNEGAYAQTTFHIFTKTQDNNPDIALPLLTYNRPVGSYGAQPILLDFYLTNAPLHLVARENPDDDILDWRIRCTVNGESFILDQWQPIYLKGFKPGKNWVQLELLDELGNPVKNNFNNAVGLITYEPNGKDTLSQLVRGELSVAEVLGIVDPNYMAPMPVFTPEETPAIPGTIEPEVPAGAEKAIAPEEIPAVTREDIEPAAPRKLEPLTAPEAQQTTRSPVKEMAAPREAIPEELPIESQVEKPITPIPVEKIAAPIEKIPEVEPTEPKIEVEAEQSATPTASRETVVPVEAIPELTAPTSERLEKSGAGKFFRGLFNRFQRPPAEAVAPVPNQLDSSTPEAIEVLTEPAISPISPAETPAIEVKPEMEPESPADRVASPKPEILPIPEETPTSEQSTEKVTCPTVESNELPATAPKSGV